MHDLLHMADQCQHREHRLDEDAILPRTSSTQFEVGGIALGRMEGRITQDNHPLLTLPNEPLQGVIRHVRGGTVPRNDQAILVQHQTQFAPDNPAMIGEPFAADLLWTAAFTWRVEQLDAIRVDDAEHRRRGHEGLGPALMSLEEAKEAGAFGKPQKQWTIIAGQPPVKRAGSCSCALRIIARDRSRATRGACTGPS